MIGGEGPRELIALVVVATTDMRCRASLDDARAHCIPAGERVGARRDDKSSIQYPYVKRNMLRRRVRSAEKKGECPGRPRDCGELTGLRRANSEASIVFNKLRCRCRSLCWHPRPHSE